MNLRVIRAILVSFILCFTSTVGLSQSTAFTYQGTLNDGGAPANGTYDLEFRLFDQESGGTQIGPMVSHLGVSVSEGVFTVPLNFGAEFPGSDRWLEIRVRLGSAPSASGVLGGFTTLTPRQRIRSNPYSVRSSSSATADNFTGDLSGDVTGTQGATVVTGIRGIAVNGAAPTNDQMLRFDSTTNEWRPETISIPNGDITGVTAGTGLSGGGTAGSVTLGVANSGIGPTQLASGSVTDDKIVSVSGAKVTGPVGEATNAEQLGGTAASQFVQTNDARLSDARMPLPGSANYIRNGTTLQSSTSFNISGTGTANRFNAADGFWMGVRVIHPTNTLNFYAGPNAGNSAATGTFNTLVGSDSGSSITSGFSNSFYGGESGLNNTTGSDNSFFGAGAGGSNIAGSSNAYFGFQSGVLSTASSNSFFGAGSGDANTSGANNSFLGFSSGGATTTGSLNLMLGYNAGIANTSGGLNTIIGAQANLTGTGLSNATAIGSRSLVAASNSLILGSIDGVNGASADTRVGIGITAPTNVFTVVGNGTTTGGAAGAAEVVARFRQRSSSFHLGVSIDSVTNTDPVLYLAENGSAKWGIRNDAGNDTFQIRYHAGGANNVYFGISTTGQVSLSTLGAAGSTSLCRNASNQISTCSSSIRYKSDVLDFRSSGRIVHQLRPVSFAWKGSGLLDLGLVAEEVAEIEPLLVTYNKDGMVEGVKYDRIGVVLINVIKEQQEELERQYERSQKNSERIEQLESELSQLKELICSANPTAAACVDR